MKTKQMKTVYEQWDRWKSYDVIKKVAAKKSFTPSMY